MTHIANCIRPDADKSNVYITQETSTKFTVSVLETNFPTQMNYHLPRRSKSLRNLQAEQDLQEPLRSLDRSPSLLNLQLQALPPRYQLWPLPSSRSPVGRVMPSLATDRSTALSMGRSPTSLSDTAVNPETVPFWQRSGSLSRRRKVSVPELGGTMTTVQEMAIDSPTIPGRPPLRKASTEAFGHERSSSAPGTSWRAGPFGDALMSCVTGPSHVASDQARAASPSEPLATIKQETPSTFGRPLSPILSPGASSKPALKVDTNSVMETIELPPEVPPKSPYFERKGSPVPPRLLSSKSSATQLMTPASTTSGGATPLSAIDIRRSPGVHAPLPTPLSAISNPFSATSPLSGIERSSPRIEKRDPMTTYSHSRNQSDTSIMDRGRPTRRSSKRQRSRTESEANNPETPVQDGWKLPKGLRVAEASVRMQEADKELLHKQAQDQAEKFEVLNKRDVASMSRELRALDERCDYLRKTYKSLRAGRQKLHGRMISYLKRGETVIFSRESLLKQEEALAELDISIDEFILKLEQAENRRLRLRQKLLEHVAAALVLNPAAARVEMAESTPPRSPLKAESPVRIERKDVESIKIYADGHVLNLFSDIEQAIGKMCEQAC
ncbi:Up-regulated during septation-domain-containing protein [Lophiotrema nucula]|uniref:Up-regulated during septation-domain-containing protein n=1 Tax=Lophiotrema nucula TaxID=690887 RepID=A0A6A5Z5I0_9PLEO|nr:Up-regulated during septation-domain-containing protein [Lophiotrema nucula]